MPGGLATSSASTSSRPWVEKTSTAYSLSFAQCRCISCSDDTSCAQRLSPTLVASALRSRCFTPFARCEQLIHFLVPERLHVLEDMDPYPGLPLGHPGDLPDRLQD